MAHSEVVWWDEEREVGDSGRRGRRRSVVSRNELAKLAGYDDALVYSVLGVVSVVAPRLSDLSRVRRLAELQREQSLVLTLGRRRSKRDSI